LKHLKHLKHFETLETLYFNKHRKWGKFSHKIHNSGTTEFIGSLKSIDFLSILNP